MHQVMEGQDMFEYRVNLPRLEIKFLRWNTHLENW